MERHADEGVGWGKRLEVWRWLVDCCSHEWAGSPEECGTHTRGARPQFGAGKR